MLKKLSIFILLCLTAVLSAQKVTNARFEQVGKQVELTYTLDKQADISVYLSTDGGKTYGSALRAVTGDVGRQVSPGQKKIIWSPLDERDGIVSGSVVFKIVPSGVRQTKTVTVNGVTFTMVYVEGGTFTMGCTSEQGSDCYNDEEPAHSVTLSSYYIGQTEVTQGLWQAVMGSNPSYFKKGNNYPVESVSWYDCQNFISRLNSLTGLRFALPTEAQWEFAARGGKNSRGYKSSGSNSVGDVAWYSDNSSSTTHPVGQKKPNELGIYDMSGNVWEWCQDWYGSYSSSSQSNPTGASSGSYRVARGGGWGRDAGYCRVSHRGIRTPDYRNSYLGLRLVLAP